MISSMNPLGFIAAPTAIVQIVVSIFRGLFRRLQEYDSRSWPTTNGFIESTTLRGATVDVWYTYAVKGDRYSSLHQRTFGLLDSALEYSRQFMPKGRVIVRYSDSEPNKSLVSDDDQAAPPVWATRYG